MKDSTLGHTTYHSQDAHLSMNLIKAPTAIRFGASEPRTYLDINPERNFSGINFSKDMNNCIGTPITTNFSKVRIVIT